MDFSVSQFILKTQANAKRRLEIGADTDGVECIYIMPAKANWNDARRPNGKTTW